MNLEKATIGIFDSGVGGLSIFSAIRKELPGNPVLYFADQAHVPYGPRPLEEVRRFSEEITGYLLACGARIIVVACNTASAAALHSLRETFPQVSFVGMEPAVKPAAEKTNSGVVGVLATPATFQGLLYASVVERFATGVKILQDTCTGLVTEIENGHLSSNGPRQILERALQPMLKAGVDVIVLGCTHYPFVIPLVKEIAGKDVLVIDPSQAVASQVKRVLIAEGLTGSEEGPVGGAQFITTKDGKGLAFFLSEVLKLEGQKIREVHWQNGRLLG